MIKVHEISGKLCWVEAEFKNSKVHMTLSVPKDTDFSKILVLQSPKHKNLELLNFENEIERIDMDPFHQVVQY